MCRYRREVLVVNGKLAGPTLCLTAAIPAVTLEASGPAELELTEVKHGVKGIETLLNTLGMVKRIRLWDESEPVYYRST